MSTLKKFSGYKGNASLIELNGMEFFVVASTSADLERLYNHILSDAEEPFSPEHMTGVILVSASVLPDKPNKNKSATPADEER